MIRLAALALVLGGLAAAALLVPVHGRTVAARWRAAEDPGAFFSSAWDELRGPDDDERTPRPEKAPKRAKPRAERSEKAEKHTAPPARAPERVSRPAPAPRPPPAAAPAPAPAPAPSPRAPAEQHSASDRAALDRLLSERSR